MNENPVPDGSPGQFYQTLKEEFKNKIKKKKKEEWIPVLKLIQKVAEEEISPNSFYESNITLMPEKL